MRVMTQALACALSLGLSLAATATAGAQSVEEFYKGKQIRMLIGGGAGGTYDTFGRLVVRHMANHIPGQPHIIPQNLPGAGGIAAASTLYTGPQDGSVFAALPRPATLDPLLSDRKFEYDAQKLKWLGSLSVETNMIVTWHTSAVKTRDDLWKHAATFAATGTSTDGVIYGKLINQWLGGKMKTVAGYKGSPEMFLAMERGEVEGRAGVPWSTVKSAAAEWIRDKKINLVAQLALEKDPDIPDVPMLLDAVKDPTHRQAFELLFMRLEAGRPYAAPPEIPADRLKALRDAFAATVKDKAFQADVEKAGLDLNLRTGEQVQALIHKAYATPKTTVDLLKSVLKQ
jgi:tripartite-type tricarboxylate transporter receptor subunit TctC